MRKKIDGNIYDTEASTEINHISYVVYTDTDCVRKLYKTKDGLYFFYDNLKVWDSATKQREVEVITPTNPIKAKIWAEKPEPLDNYKIYKLSHRKSWSERLDIVFSVWIAVCFVITGIFLFFLLFGWFIAWGRGEGDLYRVWLFKLLFNR